MSRVVVASLLALAFAACDGGGTPSPEPPASASASPDPPASPSPEATPDAPGLDGRAPNTTCRPPARVDGEAELILAPVFETLSFRRPVAMAQAPGDARFWYVVEQDGVIWRVENQAEAVLEREMERAFLDIRDRVTANDISKQFENGLVGFAFHPLWPATPSVFAFYTHDATGGCDEVGNSPYCPVTVRLSRFSTDAGGFADSQREEVLIELEFPSAIHHAGTLEFGADGYLYASIGDGRVTEAAQDPNRLHGSIIRIDVDSEEGYRIPSDNPFAGDDEMAPEIWAWGFRNPWRFSIDETSGRLWAGDVGERSREELDLVVKAGNYGWPCYEGDVLTDPRVEGSPEGDYFERYWFGDRVVCDAERSFEAPAIALRRDEAGSVIGGYVYRGERIPSLQGTYLFADFNSGRLYGVDCDADAQCQHRQLARLGDGLQPTAFARDALGELYVMDLGAGRVHQIVDFRPGDGFAMPERLEDTGCFTSLSPLVTAPGLVPYDVVAPLWSDGAAKARWIALPDGEQLRIDAEDALVAPIGSVLLKHFERAGQPLETRFLIRLDERNWRGYSYAWRGEGEAILADAAGEEVATPQGAWRVPSQNDCLRCHTERAGGSLGLELRQQNSTLRYPTTGRWGHQLETLAAVGLMEPVAGEAPSFADSLEGRARAYLHSNCSSCHRPPHATQLDLRYQTELADAGLILGSARIDKGADLPEHIVTPGDPESSLLLVRMAPNRHGLDPEGLRMPPLGTVLEDDAGIDLLERWIRSLPVP